MPSLPFSRASLGSLLIIQASSHTFCYHAPKLRSHVIHVLNLKDFSLVKTLPLLVEGWGLTHGPNSLIMSDGSNRLYFLDPESLEVTRTLEVVGPHPKTGEDVRIDQLNELEVGGPQCHFM